MKKFFYLFLLLSVLLPVNSAMAIYNTITWGSGVRLYLSGVAATEGGVRGISLDVYDTSYLDDYTLDVTSLRLQMKTGSKIHLRSYDRKLFNVSEGYPDTVCTDEYSEFAYEVTTEDDFTITFTDDGNCPEIVADSNNDTSTAGEDDSSADKGEGVNDVNKIDLFDLLEDEAVEGLIKGDQVGFIVNGILETATVKSVGSNQASVSLSKLNDDLFLAVGETENADLDADGYRDIKIGLVSIDSNGKAKFSFEPIQAVKLDDAKPGDLIKTAVSSEVFYVGEDSMIYVFPNESVYFSWYPDFNGVKTVSESVIEKFKQGGLVTYKPGSKLVTFTTTNNVYVVGQGGLLRKLRDEQMAIDLYGDNWINEVVDISSAFVSSYKIGENLLSNIDFIVDEIMSMNLTITVDKGI